MLNNYTYYENSDLPSVEDFIVEEDLPTVEDFLREESIEEDTQTIEDVDGNTFIEVRNLIKPEPWIELVKMINDVRGSIPEVPEVKDYAEDLDRLYNLVEQIRSEIPEVPEVRYYEDELKEIQESINNVKESIPQLPSWIERVNEVPDFSWIGKTFNVIDEEFKKVDDGVRTLEENIKIEIFEIQELINEHKFDTKVDLKTVNERVTDLKEKVYKQLKEQSEIVWNLQKKLKLNQKEFEITFSEKISDSVDSFRESTNISIKDLEEKFFESTKSFSDKLLETTENIFDKIHSLPKPKYYEEDLDNIRNEISSLQDLREIIESIKEKQTELQENYLLTEPPSKAENIGTGVDPLTPLDQKFATLKDLAEHYRIFINRVQTQLSTMGGGGAGFIKDLDDVDITGIATDSVLKYDYNNSKWIVGTGVGKTTLVTLDDVNTSNLGDGRFLRYDASTLEFTFAPVSATNLELVAGDIQSGILTTNSTNPAVIMSISATTYRSIQYQVQVTEGSNYNMTQLNIIHDGSQTYQLEFGSINQPIGIATFSSAISGGSVQLIGYPLSSNTTTFKTVFTAIQV